MADQFTIDTEIANLCRALTAEEEDALRRSLQEQGLLDALKTWNGILLDGHNRHRLCVELGKEYRCEPVPGLADRASAIQWVITNQLGRRNLIPEDIAYLRGKRYEAEKMRPGDVRSKRSRAAGTEAALRARGLPEAADKFAEKQGPDHGRQNVGRDKTAVRLAKEHGVNSRTVERDQKFAAAVDKIGAALGKEIVDLIRTGRLRRDGMTKAAIIAFAKDDNMTTDKFTDLRFAQQQRRTQARKARKKTEPKARKAPLTAFKKTASELDTRPIERMRSFMHALMEISTTSVTAKSLAGYSWPDGWRKQVNEALPGALNFLEAFETEFHHGTVENRDDENDAA